MGHGTIIGFEDASAARADIPLREAQQGGAIDPQYLGDLRAMVTQREKAPRPYDVPAGMTVRIGDRVALQNSYRSKTPCAYVPVQITADLGPASGRAPQK